ncbi:MAG: hypothetical protein JWN34_6248 [Bryobacterales bacterium]|nr:hypothetical protein [Bryobacterales bacterium]
MFHRSRTTFAPFPDTVAGSSLRRSQTDPSAVSVDHSLLRLAGYSPRRAAPSSSAQQIRSVEPFQGAQQHFIAVVPLFQNSFGKTFGANSKACASAPEAHRFSPASHGISSTVWVWSATSGPLLSWVCSGVRRRGGLQRCGVVVYSGEGERCNGPRREVFTFIPQQRSRWSRHRAHHAIEQAVRQPRPTSPPVPADSSAQ